tara:strand:+ start:554 stop:1162 length:609 start_codon:yes stop_codon:yes gene_type:complete
MTTNSQPFTFQGRLTNLEHKTTQKGAAFIRTLLVDDNNQSMWLSCWDSPTIKLIDSQGVGSGPWTIRYIEKSTSTGSIVKNIVHAGISAAPPQQAQPQQAQPQQAQPQQAQQPLPQQPQQATPQEAQPSLQPQDIDDRTYSIVRQVAFKEVEHKDDKALETIAELVDSYTRIILGTFAYIPMEDMDNATDDEIIRQGNQAYE